jgi:hypothetical protein
VDDGLSHIKTVAIFVAIVVATRLIHKNRQVLVARGYNINYNVDHMKSTSI